MKKYELTTKELAKLCRDFQADCFDGFVSTDEPYIKRWLKKCNIKTNKYREYVSINFYPRIDIKRVEFPQKGRMSFTVNKKHSHIFEQWFEKSTLGLKPDEYKIKIHCQIVSGTKLKNYEMFGTFPCNIDFRSGTITLSYDYDKEIEDGHTK